MIVPPDLSAFLLTVLAAAGSALVSGYVGVRIALRKAKGQAAFQSRLEWTKDILLALRRKSMLRRQIASETDEGKIAKLRDRIVEIDNRFEELFILSVAHSSVHAFEAVLDYVDTCTVLLDSSGEDQDLDEKFELAELTLLTALALDVRGQFGEDSVKFTRDLAKVVLRRPKGSPSATLIKHSPES